MTWTDEQETTLKAMWAEGLSASKIGDALGTTRNAVIGKVNRLGLTAKDRPSKPQPLRLAPFRKQPAAMVEATDIPNDGPSPFACTLHELTTETCRWPIGDPKTPEFHFCGAKPIEQSPYCWGHHRMAYQVGSRAA